MLRFKFQQNRTINEEIDIWGVKGALISKIRWSLIENSGLNTHTKFQHFSSIRKGLKFGGTDWLLGG